MGRRMQVLVDHTVGRVLQVGYTTAMARAEAVLAVARRAKEQKEKGEQALANVDRKLTPEIFEVFAATRRNLQREKWAMRRAESDSKQAATFRSKEEKKAAEKKAEADCAERLKCPEFRHQVYLERITKKRAAQAENVAFHAQESEKKRRRVRDGLEKE